MDFNTAQELINICEKENKKISEIINFLAIKSNTRRHSLCITIGGHSLGHVSSNKVHHDLAVALTLGCVVKVVCIRTHSDKMEVQSFFSCSWRTH